MAAPLLGESSQRRARGSRGGEEEGAGGYCGWYIISELEVCFLMVDGMDVGQSFSSLA